MRLYALHDKKARALSSFAAFKNSTVASRDFAGAVLEPKSVLAKYPDDFELVCVSDLFEDSDAQQLSAADLDSNIACWEVVLTARQVLDANAPRESGDQLSLIKEA